MNDFRIPRLKSRRSILQVDIPPSGSNRSGDASRALGPVAMAVLGFNNSGDEAEALEFEDATSAISFRQKAVMFCRRMRANGDPLPVGVTARGLTVYLVRTDIEARSAL